MVIDGMIRNSRFLRIQGSEPDYWLGHEMALTMVKEMLHNPDYFADMEKLYSTLKK